MLNKVYQLFVYENDGKKTQVWKKGVPLDLQVCGNTYKSTLRFSKAQMYKYYLNLHTYKFILCTCMTVRNRTEWLRKLGNGLDTTWTSLTRIGVFICHKRKRSSVAVGKAEKASSPSRAADLPGKFTACKGRAVKWFSLLKIIAHASTVPRCVAAVLFVAEWPPPF